MALYVYKWCVNKLICTLWPNKSRIFLIYQLPSVLGFFLWILFIMRPIYEHRAENLSWWRCSFLYNVRVVITVIHISGVNYIHDTHYFLSKSEIWAEAYQCSTYKHKQSWCMPILWTHPVMELFIWILFTKTAICTTSGICIFHFNSPPGGVGEYGNMSSGGKTHPLVTIFSDPDPPKSRYKKTGGKIILHRGWGKYDSWRKYISL